MILRDAASPTSETNVSFPEFVDWRTQSANIADVAAFFNTTHTHKRRRAAHRDGPGGVRESVSDTRRHRRSWAGIFKIPKRPAQPIASWRSVTRSGSGNWGPIRRSLGGSITLDDTPYTVVAVMPRDFRGVLPRDSAGAAQKELWLPFRLDVSTAPRDLSRLTVVARLRPGVTQTRDASGLQRWRSG